MKNKTKFLLLLLLLVIIACSNQRNIPRDLTLYSQDPFSYVDPIKGDTLLVTKEIQASIDSLSMKRYYYCWSDSLIADTLASKNLLNYYQDKIEKLKLYPGIGENKLKRDSTFYYEMRDKAKLSTTFNKFKKGIMLEKANIRVLPTNKPYFLDFDKAGEGYPFDYWQNSTIPMASPVFIYHEIDNWLLISCHLCSGWVEKDKIAYLNNEQIKELTKPNRIAISKDDTPIYSKEGEYLGSADIGTFFTYLFSDGINHKCSFVKRNEWGFGQVIVINIPVANGKKMPIPLTQNNIASIMSEMINQNYGWGGMYFNRDCSQMTLDTFTPFGLILPRNGNHQASKGGNFISSQEIDKKDFNDFIIKNARPFTSLVRIPGHIMVYLGHKDGKALVMHNIWGLRTKSFWGKEGRYIIGKTIISSLELGKDIRGIDKNRLMLQKLSGLVNLFELERNSHN